MEQQESNFYRLKNSKQYPFNMSFEEFKKYYNKDKEWGKRQLWKEVLESLDICDVNEPSEDKGLFNFPFKSSDLVYAYFSALYNKGEKKELSTPARDVEQYKKFISGFFNALDEIKLKDYMKNILYSNQTIQYLKANQEFLDPFIEKISMLIMIMLLEHSKDRIEIFSRMLKRIDDILAEYVLDYSLPNNESYKDISDYIHLKGTVQELCKILKVDEKEFKNITDSKVRNKIKDYVSMSNRYKDSKNPEEKTELSIQKEEAQTLYIQYLNTHTNTQDQKDMTKKFIENLSNISSEKNEMLYERELSDFLFRFLCPKTCTNKVFEYSKERRNTLNHHQENAKMLYEKLIEGTDSYYRKMFTELLLKFSTDCSQIDIECIGEISIGGADLKPLIVEVIAQEYEIQIKLNKNYDYRNMNEFINYVKDKFTKRYKKIEKLKLDYWNPFRQKKYNPKSYFCETERLIERKTLYFPEDPTMNFEILRNFPKYNKLEFFAQKLLTYLPAKISVLPENIVDFLGPLLELCSITSCDNIVIYKQMANKYAHEFVIKKKEYQQKISKKIQEIKQSNMYSRIDKGINTAVYDFLFDIYKK